MTFNDLQIINPILKAIELANYDTPTPVQTETIPLILEGKDILASAQTGTGKTAAFAIPILQKLYQTKDQQALRKIKALILTPTRELANQISENFTRYSRFLNLKNTAVYGGVHQRKQESILYKGIDVLIATPGRLLDLMNQNIIHLNQVEYLVIDEADMMFDMGFIKDVNKIIESVPKNRQTLLFSATISKEIEYLAKDILLSPIRIDIAPEVITLDVITQSLYIITKKQKTALLIELIKTENIASVLVFMRTKHSCNKVVQELEKAEIKAEAIHSNKSQAHRERALLNFKKGRLTVLVATDIAARGLDIKALDVVVNYDLPETPETYIHRIGRTGRAGLSGRALSFCSYEEKSLLRTIEKHIDQKLTMVDHPFSNEELTAKFIEKPKQKKVSQPRSNKPISSKPNNDKSSNKPKSYAASDKSPYKPKSSNAYSNTATSSKKSKSTWQKSTNNKPSFNQKTYNKPNHNQTPYETKNNAR